VGAGTIHWHQTRNARRCAILRLLLGQDSPQGFFVLLIALLVALLVGLVFHELCHALVADALGDDTPRNAGRISLNPLHHLDPLGTMMMVLVGFGWAKPVPVNGYRLRNGPIIGMATVAAAGPVSNFVMAALFALPVRFGLLDARFPSTFDQFTLSNYLALIFIYVVLINVLLGVFNLIPLAPLDGSRVAQALLPGELGRFFRSIEPYGMGILFLLITISWLTNGQIDVLGAIINPVRDAVVDFLL
jgi:Zn-dependent protease